MAKNKTMIKKINNAKKTWLEFNFFRLDKGDSIFNLLNKKIVILNPIYATTIPPTISVKKCAPTTTLLNAIRLAKKIKKYLILGRSKEKHKATTKIVEVCPEGYEWKDELRLKKSNSKLFSIME